MLTLGENQRNHKACQPTEVQVTHDTFDRPVARFSGTFLWHLYRMGPADIIVLATPTSIILIAIHLRPTFSPNQKRLGFNCPSSYRISNNSMSQKFSGPSTESVPQKKCAAEQPLDPY